MKNRFFLFCFLVPFCYLVSGCHEPAYNLHKEKFKLNYGYRYQNGYRYQKDVSEDTVVVLSLSGGGIRAAALAYGVMLELYETRNGSDENFLASEVDLVSSVSGGSFAAAYYGLKGDDFFDDTEGFKKRFLEYEDRICLGLLRGYECTGALSPFNLYNWYRYPSPYYHRNDYMAEVFDETLFDEKTFEDLERRYESSDMPFIAINATNMSTGQQFTFSQRTFDLLGSDLSTFPVSRAVAASAAFPGLLSPITLKNQPASEGYGLTQDIELALAGKREQNYERYLWAESQALYHNEKSKHPWVHLIDGGLSDNLGIRYVINQIKRTSGVWSQSTKNYDNFFVIVVNASNLRENYDRDQSSPNIKDTIFFSGSSPVDNTSSANLDQLRNLLTEVKRNKLIENRGTKNDCYYCMTEVKKEREKPSRNGGTKNDFYYGMIEINLRNYKDKTLLDYPTRLFLRKDQVEKLIAAGRQLLRDSEEFQKIKEKLGYESSK